MNRSEDAFDPSVRIVPKGWMEPDATLHGARPGSLADSADRSGSAHRWITTVAAPLAQVGQCTKQVFEAMHATLAYLYESEDKIVVRASLPERQVRAELRSIDGEPHSTRIMVVVGEGAEVDRLESGRIVEAIERALRTSGVA